MFFPLHDQNPLRVVPFQFVTLALLILSALGYLWQGALGGTEARQAVLGLGMIPAVTLGQARLPPELALLPAPLTLISYTFLHEDIWHLAGNMLFLWVFGDNIEDSMGHLRFLVFYPLCGAAAGLTHALLQPGSLVPVIGASGAVSGVLGAYLVLHPRVRVLALLFKKIPLFLPAYLLIGAWLAMQFVSVFYSDQSVAWWAHIGGFFAGAALIVPLRHKSLPLFDRGQRH